MKQILLVALNEIIADVAAGNFTIEDSFEDVHSKIEYLLTEIRWCRKKNSYRAFS
jgi:argininosuccinate lyase